MIQNPNLDDRTYKEIVDEAIRLIPHYCPEWTNHNPTDPGVTLIELFSWMTEMIIYRLNKVPEKTYLTLLDLVGFSLTPPQSSKVLLTFHPVEGYDDEIFIKRGTQVSTTKSESLESIIFETNKDLYASNINLDACFSTNKGMVTDNMDFLLSEIKSEGFSLFSGQDELKRHIYICDPTIKYLSEKNAINVTFNCANEIKTVNDEIVNFLEWEYWNGKKWMPVEATRTLERHRKKDNEVYISGPIDIEEYEVEGVTGYFLRASLVNVPERTKCFEINDVVMNLLFYGEGINPDLCICNTDNMIFNIIDINKDFKPFVDIPKYNDTFYIAADEVFSKEDSEISINFYLGEIPAGGTKPEPNEELVLKYEYWNGKTWLAVGETTIEGVYEPQGEFKFTDSTDCLLKNGEVKFVRPDDFKPADINGDERYWLRVRIGAGDFGTGGQYIQDEHGKWSWIYDKPLAPPLLNQIRLRYYSTKKPVKKIFSFFDFTFHDFSETNIKNYQQMLEDESKVDYFTIFKITKEKCPVTYFGFNKRFHSGENSIYFKLNERKMVKKGGPNILGKNKLGIKTERSDRKISLKWEYWDGTKWKRLSVNDYMDSFHESGFIEFICPEDLKSSDEFGKNLYWLRLIFESGSFEINPMIVNVHMNSVYAYNQKTYFNENLGSSNGTPSQEFRILHGPILPGIEVLVRETELPPADERDLIMEEEGEDAIIITKDSNGNDEVWVRYHEVDNFYASVPKSRHYCINYHENKIIFGDGLKGMIPPRKRNNIRIARYMTGGGVDGNVGSGTITILRENIPYIAKVINPYSAEGGADLENLERLKSRATYMFKNLNRAVTSEDYEWLAREASTSVARAKCLSRCGKNGEVILIVVPKPDSDDFNMKDKLFPTAELLRRVKEFLDIRKLVGTKLSVTPPNYKNISINLKIVFKKDLGEVQILKNRVELSLRRYLHPITGGTQGDGWPFGVPLTKNEIFKVLEKINGIYYIEEIEIMNDDLEVEVEKLILDEDDLIYVNKINITERQYQF